jgi:hypothetical protein
MSPTPLPQGECNRGGTAIGSFASGVGVGTINQSSGAMARFIMTCAMAGAADGDAYRKYPALTTIADTRANALPGDYVWAALCAGPWSNLAPLDAAASALCGRPVVTANTAGGYGGAAGQNAGA